jgi:hypothetical protein
MTALDTTFAIINAFALGGMGSVTAATGHKRVLHNLVLADYCSGQPPQGVSSALLELLTILILE